MGSADNDSSADGAPDSPPPAKPSPLAKPSKYRRPGWLTLFVLAVLGVALVRQAVIDHSGPATTQQSALRAHSDDAGAAPGDRYGAPVADPLAHSPAVRLELPSLGVTAPVTAVDHADDGTVEAPPATQPRQAAWDQGGAAPGEKGTAVMVGRESAGAAFQRLGTLVRGDLVRVLRQDGRTAVFQVYAARRYAPGQRPPRATGGQGGRPELRLLTGPAGTASPDGHVGTLVVSARLTQTE